MKRVRRASDLPEWFRLDNYARAGTLDAAGWYEQLFVRRHLLSMIDYDQRHPSHADGTKLHASTLRRLQRVRAMPIVDITNDDVIYDRTLYELKARVPSYSLGVRLATVSDHYLTEGKIEPEKRTYARNYFAQTFSDVPSTLPLKYKRPDWIDEPIDWIANDTGYGVSVRVNLVLPDKVLAEQFKRLLNELRRPWQRAGIEIENRQKPNFAGWQRFGVLPYLDLRIWEMETGVKIPKRVMADAIFPPGEGGEEVVRKTTTKLAEELVTRKHLESLAAIAAQEIAERNSA